MSNKLGIVSMRNEDGTQYASFVHGELQWTENRRNAAPISQEVFAIIESQVEYSRRKDCPERGFFGIYQLKFTLLKAK